MVNAHFLLSGDKQFFVEDLDSPYPQRYPSSQQPQQPPPSILSGGVIPNQVIVEGFPQDTQEFVLQLYLGSLCQTNQCTEVKTYGNAAVATFSAPVGRDTLAAIHTDTSIRSSLLIIWIVRLSWNSPQTF